MSISDRANHEASHYESEGDKVRCLLCPHRCLISDGNCGLCGVRENRGGRLYSLIYGLASSIHPDPIEKKPFFHFMPGTTAISFGSVGCNLKCMHCQNYSISRASPLDMRLTSVTPGDVVRHARDAGAKSVSWTYNEPTIWHEFTTEASSVAHDAGLKTSYVTNGYISELPLEELKGVIDAMNIDVKAFREGFYKDVCGGRLAPVLHTCETAVKLGIHVELTYLVIPGYNDSEEEIRDFSLWVRDGLGRSVPVHFSAFHPDFKLTEAQRTPMSTMNRAYETASRAGLDFVYIGNVHAGDKGDTYCPKCGFTAIKREGFGVGHITSDGGNCTRCGEPLNLIL
jgi:pyruvate formate lyase activating enzyme